jgi:hypothetical protein
MMVHVKILAVAVALGFALALSVSAADGMNRRLLQGTVHVIDPWTVGPTYAEYFIYKFIKGSAEVFWLPCDV